MVVVRGGNDRVVIIGRDRLWILLYVYRDRQRESVIIWFNGEMILINVID